MGIVQSNILCPPITFHWNILIKIYNLYNILNIYQNFMGQWKLCVPCSNLDFGIYYFIKFIEYYNMFSDVFNPIH